MFHTVRSTFYQRCEGQVAPSSTYPQTPGSREAVAAANVFEARTPIACTDSTRGIVPENRTETQ